MQRARVTDADFQPNQRSKKHPLASVGGESREDLERELVRVELQMNQLRQRHFRLRLRLGR